MRIVQVIDSLEIGGAERMAVNYANALAKKIEFSGLVATRAEGKLKEKLNDNVDYFFLQKTKTLDFNAAARLKAYCKKHSIDFIHAHSSSYFIAVMVKLAAPKIQIIWHDHNGMSEFIDAQKPFTIKLASLFFKGIIVVNNKLKEWAKKQLHSKNVIYIPNFTSPEQCKQAEVLLKGVVGKRILCLANLREQKNHEMLLEVAVKVTANYPKWTFHLVGKDFNDAYAHKLKAMITALNLVDNVFFYGTLTNTMSVINQCDIAVLTSKSEGLPVSLLEYGLEKKPVVVTAVGEIPDIINNGINGFMTPANDVTSFYDCLSTLITDEKLRTSMGDALFVTVADKYSEDGAMKKYLGWINTIKNV